MKKFVIALIALAAAVLTACDSDKAVPEVQFSQVLYQVCSRSSVSVKLVLDEAAESSVTVPVVFAGDAKKDVEYSVASTSAVFAAGATEASVVITDLGMSEGKNIALSIAGGNGYRVGTKHTCVVALDAEEGLVYDFSAKSLDLYEKASLTLTVKGVQSGANFRAASDIEVPFTLDGDEAGVVNVSADKFVIPKGENSATIEFTVKEGAVLGQRDEDENVKVVVSGSRFVKGDNGDFTLVVKTGLQYPSKLVGTWVFDHVYDAEEVEEWFDAEGDDTALLPMNNEGFKLIITEDEESGVVALTPSGNGGFAAFFRTATMTLATPVNITAQGTVLGNYTASESNMFYAAETGNSDDMVLTYYSLSNANRAFSKSKDTPGSAVIAAKLLDGDNLIVTFRDYDEPPFGENWWTLGFDPDMFGFMSLFKRQ